MSETAWVWYVMCEADDDYIFGMERPTPWPETFEEYLEEFGDDPEFRRKSAQRQIDQWKQGHWAYAVIHSEIKQRRGLEPRYLLFWLNGLFRTDVEEAKYEGFVPLPLRCRCCGYTVPSTHTVHEVIRPAQEGNFRCTSCKGHELDGPCPTRPLP